MSVKDSFEPARDAPYSGGGDSIILREGTSGCCDCPFDYDSGCAHPSLFDGMDHDTSGHEHGTTPAWCPLRKHGAIIILIQKDKK